MMKLSKIIFLSASALFVACTSYDEAIVPDAALEIKSIDATIDGEQTVTRAVQKLDTIVGRDAFVDGNHIVFTTIKRTDNPLEGFTYKDIKYDKADGSWVRTAGNLPEKIYWTDGHNPHTFIGYSLPSEKYYWTKTTEGENDTYSGELGKSYTGTIDFSDGNDKIKDEDLLLNYNTKTVAETGGLSTKVGFTHALSNVRVIVNIKNYAASDTSLDAKTVVSDFVIKSQPTKFTWGANSSSLKVLDYEGNTKKDIKLWCPEPDGVGDGQSKTFTFYGLTTPQDATYHNINGNDKDLEFSFKVTYPDATNPDGPKLDKTYNGKFTSPVNFNSGACTTLNISLNHKNEEMLIKVTYSDWNYVATPDLGELRKKSTFIDMKGDVTIHSDSKANVYDATWLYKDANGKIWDVYGNDGSKDKPYIIKSASQLLSFAKEVKAGLKFEDQFIRLDADITMQASTAKTNVESETSTVKPVAWIGIGEDGKPFNGTFLGGDRYINRLYGKPLFVSLGDKAVVEQLHIAPIGTITGGGALAETNAGTIGGCKVVEDVTTTGGALVGTNSGTIYACYHIGTTTGIGGLVGTNTGTGKVIGCYQAGDVVGGTSYGIVGTNEEGGTINCPEATSIYQIQQKDFVEALNKKLTEWNLETQFQFVHNSASYPTVTKVSTNN